MCVRNWNFQAALHGRNSVHPHVVSTSGLGNTTHTNRGFLKKGGGLKIGFRKWRSLFWQRQRWPPVDIFRWTRRGWKSVDLVDEEHLALEMTEFALAHCRTRLRLSQHAAPLPMRPLSPLDICSMHTKCVEPPY